MKKHLKRSRINLKKLGTNYYTDVCAYEASGGIDIWGARGASSYDYIVTIPLATIRAYLRRLDKKETKAEASNG